MSRGATVLPVFGPCVAMLPGDQFSLIFPVRKSTVEHFELDVLETAALVSLVDNLPKGREVDWETTIDKTWSEQEIEGPDGDPMLLIHLLAKLKEA